MYLRHIKFQNYPDTYISRRIDYISDEEVIESIIKEHNLIKAGDYKITWVLAYEIH